MVKQVIGFTAAAVVLAMIVGSWDEDQSNQAAAAPPLSLEGFLDEKLPEREQHAPKLKVDNSACYVCHGNLDTDSLVIRHGTDEVGCIDCHGESLAHRNDEDNITPPDHMYSRRAIDAMCRDCHDTHDAAARRVLLRWQQRCPEKTNPREIVCTDCHFHHKLKYRTVQWNKDTGELLIRKVEDAENKTDQATQKPVSQ